LTMGGATGASTILLQTAQPKGHIRRGLTARPLRIASPSIVLIFSALRVYRVIVVCAGIEPCQRECTAPSDECAPTFNLFSISNRTHDATRLRRLRSIEAVDGPVRQSRCSRGRSGHGIYA